MQDLTCAGLQGEWCAPNQASDAIYGQGSRNVFLQLQDQSLPSTPQDDETSELPLISTIGAPDDMPLYDTEDSSYLHFFVHQMPSILSIDYLFPNALARILGMTIGNPALWHAVLAVSSFLADKVAGRPTSRTYIHLNYALPLIQNAIQSKTINDAHVAAVFLLGYLNLATGEIASAGNHLDGLVLMLEYRSENGAADDPLINAIRRLAIRLDNVRGATGRALAFTSAALNTGISHRDWLVKIVEPIRAPAVEWAIAEFELEDLANHLLHLHHRARALRTSPEYNPATDEPGVLFQVDVLMNELQLWKMKPLLLRAEADENLSRLASLGRESGPSFLEYPSLGFNSSIFATIMIMYYRLQLLASLIIQPAMGATNSDRLETAITLCRAYASYRALRDKVSSCMVVPLFLAGIVLGEVEHPQG
jgi:Fungal specific transcription factor domain